MGSIYKRDEVKHRGDQMKNILLNTLGIVLFGIVGFSGISAEAASGPDSWSKKLKCENSCPRFKVLKDWDDAAVLDKETGLVWEQSPDANQYTWSEAHDHCNTLEISNRLGWRLPTLQELASLIDPSQTNPAIPSGHPFNNLENILYWSATTKSTNTLGAWVVHLGNGSVNFAAKAATSYAWCVRGGSGFDTQ